jgi:hypothetical protein
VPAPAPVPQPPPVISTPKVDATLSASSKVIDFGQSITLSWTTANANSISLNQNLGFVGANESITVSPKETTIYTIKASNGVETVSRSVVVIVNKSQVSGSKIKKPTAKIVPKSTPKPTPKKK